MKRVMCKIYGIMAVCLLSFSVCAMDLELTQGINAALPIGIDTFVGDPAAQAMTDVIRHDLSLSGQFKCISTPYGVNGAGQLEVWQRAGADTVLTGRVTRIGYNQYEIAFELTDAAARNRLLVKTYRVNDQQLRIAAHHVSDDVYQKLTGDRGVFSTRIAYILVQRHGDKARYSLEIADMDGENAQSLLTSSEPIMSPTWSPDGRQLAYVSFEKKRAQIFSVSAETGQRRLLTDFPGINGAPAWSPDGRQMAVVLSKGGSPKIYLVDLSNGAMKQVTFGDAIDTEPSFSPDGRSLLFTSGRGGSPQVYRLNLADGGIARITYNGNYNARASYTANQQNIVMLHRDERQFNIGTQALGTGQVTTLTNAQMDESPSVAPNGRLIVYATHRGDQGVLAIVSLDGRTQTLLPTGNGDAQEPAWSPYAG